MSLKVFQLNVDTLPTEEDNWHEATELSSSELYGSDTDLRNLHKSSFNDDIATNIINTVKESVSFMLPDKSEKSPIPEIGRSHLRRQIHKAAEDGEAISIFARLCNCEKSIIDEVLGQVTEDNDGQRTTPLVIAAMSGKTQVVEVLLKTFGVDTEQRSTVKFDGCVIQDATALWCAAGAGHLNVVEMLVKNGANVNSATASNSTPLRAACFDGRLDIVKYLLDNGADLTIPNKYDNTCLMISSYKGHTKVVHYLLEKGADPNIKAHCGATSIHFAADCGHLSVIKELVRFKASMTANGDGMTPIMVASACGKEDIVSYLLDNTFCSMLEKIQATELLGAFFANDKENYDLGKTYLYLKRAMHMKMELYHDGRMEPVRMMPVKAYEYHQECQNIFELEAIQHNQDALHMEALTIRERILGSQNPEVPHPVIYRGAVFADNGQFDRCISLWMHSLVLRQTHSRSVAKDLLRLSQVFSQMVSQEVDLAFYDIERVIHHGIKELEIHQSSDLMETSCDMKLKAKELFHTNILSVIYLITIATYLNLSEKEILRFHKLVYLFLKCKPLYKNGSSPLHIVVDPTISVDDFHVSSLVSFPNLTLVTLFLKCGADIDATDSVGNSTLHTIAHTRLQNIAQERLRQDIVLHLLQNGAHCDIANKQRQTPFTLARGTTLSLLYSHSNLSLRCLAARCIRENNIPYHSSIPCCLKNFVDCH